MSELLQIVHLLHYYANLANPIDITFEQLIKFIAYSSRLKDDILLFQPFFYALEQLLILLPVMQLFLSEACLIPGDVIPILWKALANVAWNTKLEQLSTDGIFDAAYKTFGHTCGICM
ncbi:hypothetical protein B0H34DRAFT_784637 [Crassisporium funariophilum]|nr:hypothetical protein B0H34DRAFT_784637 [Crassisporium funariophilum]